MRDEPPRPLLGPDLTGRLDDWVARGRVAEAAAGRERERWMHQAATEEATLAGVLADAGDRGRVVALTTVAGGRHHGPLVAVGRDFCALRRDGGRTTLVRLSAVATVRPVGPGLGDLGDRSMATSRELGDVLADVAAERGDLARVLTSGEVVSGSARWLGRDVIAVRTRDDGAGTAYVALAAVAEATLA